MTKELEDGFYWVRVAGARWIPAEWSNAGKCFYLCGCKVPFVAIQFAEIDRTPMFREAA